MLLLRHEMVEVCVETLVAGVPELAIVERPLRHLLERRRPEAARPPLRVAPAGNETRALEDLEVLRDGGPAHRERLGELADRTLTGGQPREDGSAGGVGEGGEGL